MGFIVVRIFEGVDRGGEEGSRGEGRFGKVEES